MNRGNAAIWTGKYSIEIQNLPIPEVSDDAILIEVEAAGICGSDGHLIKQHPPYPWPRWRLAAVADSRQTFLQVFPFSLDPKLRLHFPDCFGWRWDQRIST